MVVSTKTTRSPAGRKPTATPSSAASLAKKPVKANTSILSFFKKAENKEGSLFMGVELAHPKSEDDIYSKNDQDRFNEHESPVKRRKLSGEGKPEMNNVASIYEINTDAEVKVPPKSVKKNKKTPFMMDSDSEEEDGDEDGHGENEERIAAPTFEAVKIGRKDPPLPQFDLTTSILNRPNTQQASTEDNCGTPSLKLEDSVYQDFDQMGDFAEFEGLDPDEYEGEEAREMRFMKEQARLEAKELDVASYEDLMAEESRVEEAQQCPVCDGDLAGTSPDEATKHVNSCLDGNPTPLPRSKAPNESDHNQVKAPELQMDEIGKRFARAAVPRPGQQNPLDLVASTPNNPKSAFTKLMSNNVEDTAWAVAAAAEKDSRGRQAYERTCPFYKIMPGFSICVDAFRYGAVEGCKAYFLSHFHSDHYIGLTANWRHGPIYCSKVTGSLVRNQLRTAEKWVVELDFDKPYDIPGTGASVTMIPANHCPGSSLFLFSKPDGDPKQGKTKRILHCGDFRACPAHTEHALLKPETVDSVSGKTKLQKIDICYLDTTYLSPRYSFPPQDDVIRACSDLCANMSPDPDCKDDVWERSAKAIGTPAVSKYFQAVKTEETVGKDPKKDCQRLLVICGTYSIGKERICIGIAKALGTKIFASPGKIKICKQLGDPELAALLTSDPLEAQVHMQMLMEIRAETLQEYLNSYKPHFSRIIGFRPSGWNFRPGSGKAVAANTPPSSIPTQSILHTKNWRTRFGYKDFVAQRGSTKEAMCFGVPYSEHSSFRELAMFVMSLRIERIIPTVNVGSSQSRSRMKAWLDRWQAERRRGGLVRALVEGEDDEENPKHKLWEGKDGTGGGAWW